ncbi:MAG: tyrosine-type recombinase/integrase [Planctomycetaceae bacterium]|nr:tyrosine-type recombinase/integrase [Planctomycetaceae bacterium]
MQDITKKLVRDFRKKLLATPYRRGKGRAKRQRQPSTVNKTMRHLAAAISPLWPPDRHNSGGKGFVRLFEFPTALPPDKRLVFTFDRKAMSTLYETADHCRLVSQPHRRSPLYEPLVWRTAMALALNTGLRTWDLFALKWEDVRWDDFRHGSIFYCARKTGKDQRPPLNRVARVHLDALRAMNLDAERVFPKFGKNKSFYAAWRRICNAAGVYKPFEQFRKTCSTMHNDITRGVGAWLCGHSARGVNAQHYDNPSQRVRNAVYALKNPAAFRRGAKALLEMTGETE